MGSPPAFRRCSIRLAPYLASRRHRRSRSSRCSGARPGSTCRRSSPRQAEQAAALRELGRRLSVGRVAFNPWTLELTIADLALAGAADGAPPLLETKRVYADVAFVSLFRLAPVIDSLEVDAPMVRVSRIGEGRYDVDDVLQRLAAAPPEGAGALRAPQHRRPRRRRRLRRPAARDDASPARRSSSACPSSARCRRSARSRSSRTSPSPSTAAASIRPARRRRSPSAATASCT